MSIAQDSEELPTSLTLRGNYPNPFSHSTHIAFDLPETASVHIEVYDVLGRRVHASPASTFPAGTSKIAMELGHLPSGAYAYRIIADLLDGTVYRAGHMLQLRQ